MGLVLHNTHKNTDPHAHANTHIHTPGADPGYSDLVTTPILLVDFACVSCVRLYFTQDLARN